MLTEISTVPHGDEAIAVVLPFLIKSVILGQEQILI